MSLRGQTAQAFPNLKFLELTGAGDGAGVGDGGEERGAGVGAVGVNVGAGAGDWAKQDVARRARTNTA